MSHEMERVPANLEHLGYPRGIVVELPPAVDIITGNFKNLPESVASSPDFISQAENRRRLYDQLSNAFDLLGNMGWNEAIEAEKIDAQTVGWIYDQVVNILDSEVPNEKMALYLPFSMLPIKNPSFPQSLQDSIERFQSSYMRSWENILGQSDVRANYFNGDLHEPEIRLTPEYIRVRKAAHIIPELVWIGYLDARKVTDIYSGAEDELKRSIADVLPILLEKDLISDEMILEIEQLIESAPEKLPSRNHYVEPSIPTNPTSVDSWLDCINHDLEILDSRYESGAEFSKMLIPYRHTWESNDAKARLLDDISTNLSSSEIDGGLLQSTIYSFLEGDSEDYKLLGLKTLYALSKAGKTVDLSEDSEFIRKIGQMYEESSGAIKNQISQITNYWLRENKIDQTALISHGIDVPTPNLSSILPINMSEFIQKPSIIATGVMLKEIETNPELSEYFFPVAIAYGSQIKGYSRLGSDIDAALFIKPNISKKDEPVVLEHLKRVADKIPELGKIDPIWTAGEGESLWIIESAGDLDSWGEIEWVNEVFGGVWMGNDEDLKKIYSQIVSWYVDLNKFGDQKQNAREYMLDRLDLESLQYRLLHSGYRRFYPDQTPLAANSDKDRDWGTFYDPGYRQLATLLFISKVFIPDIAE